MHEAKAVSTPLEQHFKLSIAQSPSGTEEKERMMHIPYANRVGSIMYGMVCSRPDLAHSISQISRFMADPGENHWEALKWTLRYLKGTSKLGLMFQGQKENSSQPLEGYVDSDFAGNLDTRKFITRYIFTLYGTTISWKASLQSVVALSTTEAEFIAVTEVVKEAIWLKGLITELGVHQEQVVYHRNNKWWKRRVANLGDKVEICEGVSLKLAHGKGPSSTTWLCICNPSLINTILVALPWT
ncbi:secreted RxLR effector protein 161-like [Primulina tabacum]|uniref:secreted RxLR effector protein 161-like n=1 Tax=Primulina tabacum TaxID=48773 RepID=UPI003F5AA14E